MSGKHGSQGRVTFQDRDDPKPMIGENRRLVTDELVEFEK